MKSKTNIVHVSTSVFSQTTIWLCKKKLKSRVGPANNMDCTRFFREKSFARPRFRILTGNTIHCQSEQCFEMKRHRTLFFPSSKKIFGPNNPFCSVWLHCIVEQNENSGPHYVSFLLSFLSCVWVKLKKSWSHQQRGKKALATSTFLSQIVKSNCTQICPN